MDDYYYPRDSDCGHLGIMIMSSFHGIILIDTLKYSIMIEADTLDNFMISPYLTERLWVYVGNQPRLAVNISTMHNEHSSNV